MADKFQDQKLAHNNAQDSYTDQKTLWLKHYNEQLNNKANNKYGIWDQVADLVADPYRDFRFSSSYRTLMNNPDPSLPNTNQLPYSSDQFENQLKQLKQDPNQIEMMLNLPDKIQYPGQNPYPTSYSKPK